MSGSRSINSKYHKGNRSSCVGINLAHPWNALKEENDKLVSILATDVTI